MLVGGRSVWFALDVVSWVRGGPGINDFEFRWGERVID
jgi:hypothetical protein